jgi:exodeoxyribonuclease VII large subunit
MSGAPIITVAELDRRLRQAVEGATGDFWVEGEVTSIKRAASGHVYFALKDEREDASPAARSIETGRPAETPAATRTLVASIGLHFPPGYSEDGRGGGPRRCCQKPFT